MKTIRPFWSFLCIPILFSAFLASADDGGSDPLASLPARYTVTDDGAWCWFSDPRAIILEGQIFAGWMTSDGSVQIGSWDLSTPNALAKVATIAPQFERDDHDHPSLLTLPDGTLSAFYAPHAWGDIHLRSALSPLSIDEWSADRTLGFSGFGDGPRGVTYANPIRLSEESNKIYLFWRGSHFKPSVATSSDLGLTWSEPATLLEAKNSDDGVRPYVKYNSDGRSRIDFLFTDGHPRNEAENSVYYLRYENGEFYTASGRRVGSFAELPFAPEQCDLVYDGALGGRAWVWDVSTDAKGNPVIVYTRHPSEDDHRYHYARWDGSKWRDSLICRAGKWFPETPEGTIEREPHYSGGISLDPLDPNRVYLSRQINGVFEIESWTTRDMGETWTAFSITRDSSVNNVRPHVVRKSMQQPAIVLWMRASGGYRHYQDYNTAIDCALVN